MLAFSKAPHIKLGWLWKLARHRNTFGMRNWKKRYITLNTKSRVLSYYKSNVDFEKKKKFAGNVILPKDASVRRTNADRDFSVEIWDGNGVKLLVLAGESEADIDVWYNTLLSVCEQMNKTSDRKSRSQSTRSSILAAIGGTRESGSEPRGTGRGSNRGSKFLSDMKHRATKLFKSEDDDNNNKNKAISITKTITPIKNKNEEDEESSEFSSSKLSPSTAAVDETKFSRIIRVEKCGSGTANGIYRAKYRTISCGAPVYVNGNGFTLQLENVSKSHMRRWYIKKGSRDFYECDEEDERHSPFVPSAGWTVCDHGGEIPPPKIINNGRSGGANGDNSEEVNTISPEEAKRRKFAAIKVPPSLYPMMDAADPYDADPPNQIIFRLDEDDKPSMDDFDSMEEMLLHALIASDILDERYLSDLPPFVYVEPIVVVEEKTEVIVKREEEEDMYDEASLGYSETTTTTTIIEEEEEEEEETKGGIDENNFAPPPPPSFNVDRFAAPPPPAYVSPRNKLKQTASFNMPPPPEYNGDDNSNLPPPPTFGFNAPPPSFGPPSPSTVEVDLPPPPPTSLPSFGNLPPPPQEETVVKRKSHKPKSTLPSAPMSWDQTSEAKARRKSRSKLPSPPGNSGDNNDSPPPLPKSLSLSRMLHNDSPPPPAVPALPPTDNIWDD